jgi:hypothetical protein
MGKKRKEKKIINMMCLCLLSHLVADINFFFLYKNEKKKKKNFILYILTENYSLCNSRHVQAGEHLGPAADFC